MFDTETILTGGGYAAVFGLMVANGLFSFPSSQVLYIIVGYLISVGYLSLLPASLAGAAGNTIGCILLYEAVRRHGLSSITRWGVYRAEELKKVEIAFKKRGPWFLFIGKLLPAIKVFVPIPAALGKMHRGSFAGIMFIASWIWSFVFIAIGYYFGKGAGMWKSYGIVLMVVAVTVVYLFYRYLNSPEILRQLEQGDERK